MVVVFIVCRCSEDLAPDHSSYTYMNVWDVRAKCDGSFDYQHVARILLIFLYANIYKQQHNLCSCTWNSFNHLLVSETIVIFQTGFHGL